MTTSNDSPSSRSPIHEAGDGYDDEWGQIENHDWPTQLISSIEHGRYLIPRHRSCIADFSDPHIGTRDHVESKLQAEADEAILNVIVSGGSGQASRQTSQQASQQAPVKVLTRPVSSGKDPAAGFSFAKAKPVQQFDFGRPKQTPVVHQSPDPSSIVPTEPCSRHSQPLPDTTQAARNAVDVAAHQSSSPTQNNTSVLKPSFPVPCPKAMAADSQAYYNPTMTTTSGPLQLDFPFTRTPPNEVFMSADDTLTESDLNGPTEPRVLNITFPGRNEPTKTALASRQTPTESVRIVDQPQLNTHNPARNAPRDLLNSVSGDPKITKSSQRKTKKGPATNGHPPPLYPKSTYTEDDLLRLLMYRQTHRQQELEAFRATQQQKEVEMQELRAVSNDLSSQLQEAIQRETQKTAELSKLKANKPIWERKIKRLSDYFKGLANDHKRLREDADDLHKQNEDVVITRTEIHNALEDAQRSLEQERVRSKQFEEDARHRIETLAQTVQYQNTQLRSNEGLLLAERERSIRMEDQGSRVTASHGQLLEIFTGHRDTIASKIDDLLHHAQSIVVPDKASEFESYDPIRPMLEQCVGMLQNLVKADTVKPEDLGKLSDTMDSFVEGITRSVEACEENSTSIEAGQKQLALAMQDQLRALSGNIFSEHALSEQISDLREVRATVREQLQATEGSLADARREIVALRHKDQEQSRRIVVLETDAAKAQSQPAEAPQTILRIQELDSRNKDLQGEIVTLKKEAADLSGQFQQSSTEAREVNERLAATQVQRQVANEEAARSREEKLASETQAISEREQLRKDLSDAAYMQLASMQSEHENIVQQLKSEKSPAEEKLKNTINQLNLLKSEKAKLEKETSRLQALLKETQGEKEAVIGTRKGLQLHLKEMEARMTNTNNENSNMQSKLNKANEQIKAKDLEIMAIQASQATRPSSSRVIGQSNYVQGMQSTRNGHALHRDSQHASIDQSPSVRPINATSFRQSSNRPPIVEDSQPTEKTNFLNLDDVMLEDPFAGYESEGPQPVAGVDISQLFPSTPGAVSHAQGRHYSRHSEFQTTVVSETQRTHHRSFREASPRIGIHTTDKSRLQSQAYPHLKAEHDKTMPRSSAGTSPVGIASRRRDANNPSSLREASITRESTQPQGSVKDPRQGKRTTAAAGFEDTISQPRPSKVQKAELSKQTKALGPVIEDSQSPRLNGRSRKMPKRKPSAPKEDKYTRRFA